MSPSSSNADDGTCATPPQSIENVEHDAAPAESATIAPQHGQLTGRTSLKDRIEILKNVVEIVAVLFAGGWAFTEFVVVRTISRLEMQDYGWLTPTLSADVGQLPDGRKLVHLRLTMKNSSRRAVRPFFTSFIAQLPPSDAEKHFLPVQNRDRVDEVKPGEEAQEIGEILVPAGVSFVVARAKTYLRHEREGVEECIFDPEYPAPDLDSLHDVPKVCMRDLHSKTRACIPNPSRACQVYRSEVLVPLEAKAAGITP